MAFHFLLIFALLNLSFAGTHATLTKEELHWKSVFPNTPMPKYLQDILPRPGEESKNAPTNKGVNDPEFGTYDIESRGDNSPNNKGVNVIDFNDYVYDDNYKDPVKESKGDNSLNNKGVNDPVFGDYLYGDDSYDDDSYDDDSYDDEYKDPMKESKDDNSPNNKGVNDPEFGDYAYDDEYKNPVKESKGNKNSLGRKSTPDKVAVIKETIYFFQKDLLPGTKVNLPRLIHKRDRAIFLPHQIEKSMPMSNNKLPEIFKNFSLKAESSDAYYVKIAVRNCERAEMKGEEKYCATSLESFIDSGVSIFGKNIQLLSSELGKETKNPLFTIGIGVRIMGENDIVCHKMKYPYAVYLCHSINKTAVYKVPVVGMDGTKANALAVCHKDTSAWSPSHIAFQVLNVKPGTVPICHFLGRDTLVWVPN